MNATDKAEALRLLDAMGRAAFAPAKFNGLYNQLRSFLSAQGEAEPNRETQPSPEHWRQAISEHCITSGDSGARWIEQRARELARQGVGNG